MTRKLLMVIVACGVLFLTSQSAAQGTVKVNPTQAVFTASPDHASTDPVLVTSYTLIVKTGATDVRSTDLGKPTPNGSGDITVPLVKTGLQNNVTYTFDIVTVGPAGSTRSTASSNPFVWADAPGSASNLRAQ
mgnify:CR=1 FL=1